MMDNKTVLICDREKRKVTCTSLYLIKNKYPKVFQHFENYRCTYIDYGLEFQLLDFLK